MQRGAGGWLWSARQLTDSVDQGYSCLWFIDHGQKSGYCVLQFPAKDLCEILNLVIFKSFQSRGLGQLMLTEIISLCREKQCTEIWLEVRKSNEVARRLYRAAGFIETGLKKQYYPAADNGREDGVAMNLRL